MTLKKILAYSGEIIYYANEFVFFSFLHLKEVPLWADKIRWFFERHFPYQD